MTDRLKYQLILLDYDGTLCNTKMGIAACIKETCKQLQIPQKDDETVSMLIDRAQTTQVTLKGILPKHLYEDSSLVEKWLTTYRALYPQIAEPLTQLFPEVEETLADLKQNELHLVVISNKGQENLQQSLRQHHIFEYFEHVFGQHASRPSKPYANLWSQHIKPFYRQMDEQRILMVGDAAPDINFAKNCNFDSCLVNFTKKSNANENNHLQNGMEKPMYTIKHFSELKTIIQN